MCALRQILESCGREGVFPCVLMDVAGVLSATSYLFTYIVEVSIASEFRAVLSAL